MHYYKRNLGEYARDTTHLTTLEHGIYNLLLDRYYASEKPIPDDKAARYAGVDRDAVEPVLVEFFKKTPAGWIHSRADREMEAYRENADKSRANGRKGGRKPKGNQPGTNPVPDSPPPETGQGPGSNQSAPLTTNQEPLTINQEKSTPKAPAKARRPAVGAEMFSPGFLRFWDAYPDGKRSKKLEAWHVWKRDGMEEFVDTIVRDVEARKVGHHDWVKEDGRFIPGAQVYLNGRRWNDDILPLRTEGRRTGIESQNQQTAQAWVNGERHE